MLPVTIDLEDGTSPLGKSSQKKPFLTWIRVVLSDKDSFNLFSFLLLNFSFAFVELLYGMWTNSFSLISDSFHMFFDCTGLLAGLVAAVITKWDVTDKFSYGYVRAEILGGFANALLLLFVSFFVFAESVERMVEPPEVKHERLFVVSVLGLLVNLVGIFIFQHGGSHGHSHGGGGHGHSHGGHGHGHSHNGQVSNHGHSHSHGEQGSRIMQGVFLHVLADTLGSVGVIISSLLIDWFGWMIADPICSMCIAILIFLSVIGLLKDSGSILLQRQPREFDHLLPGCYNRVTMLPGVFSVQEKHFWTICTGQTVGNLKLEVSAAADPRFVTQQTNAIFKSIGVTQLYVQLDYSTT